MSLKKIHLGKIILSFLLLLAVLFFTLVIGHHGMKLYEQKYYPAPGNYVSLDNRKMHVYVKGDGEKTIVLLPGLGTTAPVLDFEPLINELAENFKVAVVEPYGYGWSDLTDRKRTVEHIVEEIRLALQTSQIDGPYIFMPHSVAGIYTMYYAHHYPAEVEAVIGIDPTLPQAIDYFNEPVPKIPSSFRFLAPSGIARLSLQFNLVNTLPLAEEHTYSVENLTIAEKLTAWKGYNKNIIDEANELENTIEKTKSLDFPTSLPVMIFMKEDHRVAEDGKSTKRFYELQLQHVDHRKLISLSGHHYLHWQNYKEMTKEIEAFTSSY